MQDDAQAEIEGFANRHAESHNVRLARHGRREILRRICVNYPHVEAAVVTEIFEEELQSVLDQGYLSAEEAKWLGNLKKMG